MKCKLIHGVISFSALFLCASCLDSLEKCSSPLEHSYFRHNIAHSRTYYMLVTEYRAYYITVTWPSGNLCVLPTPCMLFLDVNVVSDLHVVLSLWWLCLLGLVCFTQTWLLLLHFLRPLATNVLLGFVLLQWGWFHIWSCRELFSAVTLAVT